MPSRPGAPSGRLRSQGRACSCSCRPGNTTSPTRVIFVAEILPTSAEKLDGRQVADVIDSQAVLAVGDVGQAVPERRRLQRISRC